MFRLTLAAIALCLAVPAAAWAGVGDPQVKTNRPWYPGELACSTFERLQATQAERHRHVTGIEVTFHWSDDSGPHTASHTIATGEPADWKLPIGKNIQTSWGEYRPVVK